VTHPRLPRLARWALRLAPAARANRADVEADLLELFATRRTERGALHAHRRLLHDVASLWLERRLRRGYGAQADLRRGYGAQASFAFLRDARIDLRYAARLFARQPAILLLTIVGLSLGLGIATAGFSILNAAALRGEGVVDPDRAPGILRLTDRSVMTAWTYDEFVHLREGSTRMQVESVLTDGAMVRTTLPAAAAEGDAPVAGLAFVSGGFFAATGGRVRLGRPLEPADEQHVGPPPVVVSFVFWTTRLDRDPAVVGRTIRIGRTEARIVGVAERGFSVPHNRLLWLPMTAYGAVYDATPVKRTPSMGVEVFGRLTADATLAEAEAQLSGVASTRPADAAGGASRLRVRLDPGAGLGRLASSERLVVTVSVFAVIALVLVLACANVASVLISTAITREREMGVRAALGASRWRLIRQLITESLALGAIAAALGLMFAWWSIPTIGTLIEAPAGIDLAPDATVYMFLALVTVLTGVGAGLAPAWHGRGADLVSPLKGDGARETRVAPRRLRSMLVMTQAAVSVLLIVMATLFVRATFRAAAIDVGFDAPGLYAISPGLGRDAYANEGAGIRAFWTRAIPELEAIAGVASVGLVELTPFSGETRSAITRDQPSRIVHFNRARAEAVETLGLRVLSGRLFSAAEVAGNAPVALVSESLARAYWPGQSPLGQPLPAEIPLAEVGPAPTRPVIIGVVNDSITARLHERGTLTVYQPLDPANEMFGDILVRVAPDATGAIQHVRQRLQAIAPQADIRITSVAALLQEEAGRPRMLATLSGIVGTIAIVLCVIGLYGLTASVIGQRTREMGVRVALGADRRNLLRMLMWDSLRPVVLGLAVGAGAALLISRVAGSAMLFGVSAQDPLAYAGAAGILLAAATLAVLMPTRRAAAVDAAFVLRQS
jgi:putative ABC transport system permease protein